MHSFLKITHYVCGKIVRQDYDLEHHFVELDNINQNILWSSRYLESSGVL